MAILTTLILFVYGMVGWQLFGEELPHRWGTIGDAMLTLFVMLTLINPTYMDPLYTTTIGRILLVISAVMITAGSLVIKRIVDIKV